MHFGDSFCSIALEHSPYITMCMLIFAEKYVKLNNVAIYVF